ncbi:MAG: hypothetical protein MJZ02_09270 [Paludibacteraceae bacterium]|nr:hypothetical protein [Paludibacteraceae bacterium]
MKKLILSVVTMASLAFAANAVTNMCVKTKDGKVVEYDVEDVSEVYFYEIQENDQGVTVSGKIGLYTYVNLGLPSGTKWATYNVGATKPTEYGDYFAWGETQPKEAYSYENYKFCKASGYTKYYTVDEKRELEAEDDAATANWGSAWRMPTTEEQRELLEGCDWEWVEDFNGSGVNGQLGTSTTNGNKIFLPAAGIRFEKSHGYAGIYGDYWSSSVYFSYEHYAFYLYFSNGSIGWDESARYDGQCVRAVLR